jgi:hypothetical protein
MRDQNKKYLIPFLFFIVLISRLPFLNVGYGAEEDSWGIALAAFNTKMTVIYEPSRFPGHPVQELIYSALWGAGPMVYNGLCAMFSALAAVFFALILKHLDFKFYFLAALAFAFIPVVFISGTYTIDFLWSEAFVLMSFYYLLKNKLIITGIFLGLAIGCRITSGAMLFPFMIILWQNGNVKNNFIQLLKISLPMIIVALVAFLPIILQFGTSFFMYYDQFPYPPLTKVIYKMSLGVFGLLGIVGLFYGVTITLIKRRAINHGELYMSGINKRILVASVIVILLYVISYFRLPQKSGYMIPVIPFIIILCGYYFNGRNFKIMCFSLIIAPFILSINVADKFRGAEYSTYAAVFKVSGQTIFFDPVSGPIFSDYSKRIQKMKYTDETIAKINSTTTPTDIIAGWWYNEIQVTMIGKTQNPNVIIDAYIDQDKINDYVSRGYSIQYLPEQNIYNDQMYKMQITDQVAKPFN